IAEQVMAGSARDAFLSCPLEEGGCLEETIADFGRKAYRRPLSVEERDELWTLAEAAATDVEAATAVLVAILTSPHFLEREIVGPEAFTGVSFQLTSHELATLLSYFLVGGPPDDGLSQAADFDLLGTDEQLLAHAERLLATPAAARAVRQFHRSYLRMETGRWFKVSHDADAFPLFTAETLRAAERELDAF